MKLILGLGNPGEQYERTRHNVGWRVLDAVEDAGWSLEKKFNAEVVRVGELLLCKPQTFMNNSGEAARAICDYYKIDASDVMVVYDDIDIDFGVIRMRSAGSAGGHNGVKSIIQHVGTTEFHRMRIGVRPPHPVEDTGTFVLARFSGAEEEALPQIISAGAEIIKNAQADMPEHQDFSVL